MKASARPRIGVMVPLPGRGIGEHRDVLGRFEAAGYDDLWVGEVNEFDAVTPLALAAAWTQRIGLGTGGAPGVRGALAAVDDEVVDELVVHGTPARCASQLARFTTQGATALALTALDGSSDSLAGLLALAEELPVVRAGGSG